MSVLYKTKREHSIYILVITFIITSKEEGRNRSLKHELRKLQKEPDKFISGEKATGTRSMFSDEDEPWHY